MRLIDGDALKYAIDKRMDDSTDESFSEGLAEAMIEIGFMPTIEPPTTTWLGNFCPYRSEHCGHYSDSKTPFCAWCGRRASNYE